MPQCGSGQSVTRLPAGLRLAAHRLPTYAEMEVFLPGTAWKRSPLPQSSPDDMETIAGCLTLPMAWPRLSDFHGSRSTFISCRMCSWVVRLGIRSVASLCSGSNNGRWGVPLSAPLLAVMVLHSGTLPMFQRTFGSDKGHRADGFRNVPARSDLRIASGHAQPLRIGYRRSPARCPSHANVTGGYHGTRAPGPARCSQPTAAGCSGCAWCRSGPGSVHA